MSRLETAYYLLFVIAAFLAAMLVVRILFILVMLVDNFLLKLEEKKNTKK